MAENEKNALQEIAPETAVFMAEYGFHVYLDNTNKRLTTSETVFEYLDNYGQLKSHTITAPMMEVSQYSALKALADELDCLNAMVEIADGNTIDLYADEIDENGRKIFWDDIKTEWQNICQSILAGETEYIHIWFYDLLEYLPYLPTDKDELDELEQSLSEYEQNYLSSGKT